jgi:hypothetical protein
MRKDLAALLVGLTVLSSAGMAHAETSKVNSTDAHVGAAQAGPDMTTAQAGTKTTVAQGDLVMLTDDQMNTVTAGHFNGWVHYGYYYDFWGNLWIGWHY